MPRMSRNWYIKQAVESDAPWRDAEVAADTVYILCGPEVKRKETGCYVTVWIPDPPSEIDPLEVYKRNTE